MLYRAIGVMSGSSLDGLDIVFVEFDESAGEWKYKIKAAACYEYEAGWLKRLEHATGLDAYNYLLLHTAYGKYIGQKINRFIEENQLKEVQLIATHGHTAFHSPENNMTAQLGDGAAIAATTGINTVSDLRALDMAFGGQGAPIVPMGEKWLLNGYQYFLNIGGIANISINNESEYIAFDVCPANRVLNMLANDAGKKYDAGGEMAAKGSINNDLLARLNALDYYSLKYPKSLSNNFGTDTVYPLIKSFQLSHADALRTFVEHIAIQISKTIPVGNKEGKLLVTGGGVHNTFLVERIKAVLKSHKVEIVVPGKETIDYKEALVMAFLGVLRIREENTVLNSVTGALKSSVGGAFWVAG